MYVYVVGLLEFELWCRVLLNVIFLYLKLVFGFFEILWVELGVWGDCWGSDEWLFLWIVLCVVVVKIGMSMKISNNEGFELCDLLFFVIVKMCSLFREIV